MIETTPRGCFDHGQNNIFIHGCLQSSKTIRKFCLKVKWNSNFRKIRSKIVYHLQSEPTFSIPNGMTEISLPFGKFFSLQSLIISRKQLREIEFQMVSAFSLDWFADFDKPLPLNGKHPPMNRRPMP